MSMVSFVTFKNLIVEMGSMHKQNIRSLAPECENQTLTCPFNPWNVCTFPDEQKPLFCRPVLDSWTMGVYVRKC